MLLAYLFIIYPSEITMESILPNAHFSQTLAIMLFFLSLTRGIAQKYKTDTNCKNTGKAANMTPYLEKTLKEKYMLAILFDLHFKCGLEDTQPSCRNVPRNKTQ